MKRIGVGLIGVGGISVAHALGFQAHEKAKIVAVAAAHEERAKLGAQKYGAEKYYTDYHDLLKDENVDAVDILTPHVLHAEMAVAAAEAGKHVLVEKPMAITIEECEEMILAARRAGVKLMVSHNELFFPPNLRAKEMIERGKIGKPILLRTRMGIGVTNIASIAGWRADPKMSGGGILFDAGIHRLYTSRFLMGEVESVKRALIDTLERDLKIEDLAIATIKFKGGAYGVIDMNYHSPPLSWDDRTEIIGTKGIIYMGGCQRSIEFVQGPTPYFPLAIYRNGLWSQYIRSTPETPFGAVKKRGIEATHAKTIHYSTAHFIECILDDKEPKQGVTGEDGKRVVQIARAIYESDKHGKEIPL